VGFFGHYIDIFCVHVVKSSMWFGLVNFCVFISSENIS
jgi:hypothetical protein